MLDTNIVSGLIRNRVGALAERARAEHDTICVSVIVAAELNYGCFKRGSPELTRRVGRFLSTIPVMPFEPPANREYGRIRAELEAVGRPIGPLDLFIAAHARTLGATLVTANVGEFRRVTGLMVENWLA